MQETSKSIELSEEKLKVMRKSLYVNLKNALLKDLKDTIKGSISDYIGAMLDFPLTIRQVAKLTGRSEQNIYKMCYRGAIPYTKKGGQIHINMKDISSALIPEDDPS